MAETTEPAFLAEGRAQILADLKLLEQLLRDKGPKGYRLRVEIRLLYAQLKRGRKLGYAMTAGEQAAHVQGRHLGSLWVLEEEGDK